MKFDCEKIIKYDPKTNEIIIFNPKMESTSFKLYDMSQEEALDKMNFIATALVMHAIDISDNIKENIQ